MALYLNNIFGAKLRCSIYAVATVTSPIFPLTKRLVASQLAKEQDTSLLGSFRALSIKTSSIMNRYGVTSYTWPCVPGTL